MAANQQDDALAGVYAPLAQAAAQAGRGISSEEAGARRYYSKACSRHKCQRTPRAHLRQALGRVKDTIASVEMFLPKPEDFRAVFARSMSALRASVDNFVEAMREGA